MTSTETRDDARAEREPPDEPEDERADEDEEPPRASCEGGLARF